MANPLAYWASSSVMKEKSFITLTPGVNGVKYFSLSLLGQISKLRDLGKYFQAKNLLRSRSHKIFGSKIILFCNYVTTR
jgi:hypothetical protein